MLLFAGGGMQRISGYQADPALQVLYADDVQRLTSRMSRNYRYRFEQALGTRGGVHVTPADTRSRELPAGASFDIVVAGTLAAVPESPELAVPPEWFRLAPRRCVMAEDTRPLEELVEVIHANDVQFLLAMYDCGELRQLLSRCPGLRGVYRLPHHIDTEVFRPMPLSKEFDVLLYGFARGWIYPFRERLARLLPASGLNVRIVEHPGRNGFDSRICGEGLARLINQSWLCIATPTVSDYLVAKYMEISACGSIVAGKMATEGLPVWGDNYVELHETMTDAEIVSALRAALDDKPRLLEMGERMAGTVNRLYALRDYGERFSAVMRAIAATPV